MICKVHESPHDIWQHGSARTVKKQRKSAQKQRGSARAEKNSADQRALICNDSALIRAAFRALIPR